MSANFLNFFQILASIPPNLKSKAASTLRPKNSVLDSSDSFDFSTEKSVLLSKMKCKDYYLLFQEKSEVTPTAIKSWVKHYSGIEDKWKKLFKNIPHLSTDNKLRQFSFKLLHRILVTKKKLKRFKISESEDCFYCKSPDSLDHAFLECSAGLNIFQKVIAWFKMSTELTLHYLKYSYYLRTMISSQIRAQTSPVSELCNVVNCLHLMVIRLK